MNYKENFYYIGIDLGGTTIKGAVFDKNAKFYYENKYYTKSDPLRCSDIEKIFSLINECIANSPGKVHKIGISLACVINNQNGSIIGFTNYININSINLKSLVEEKYNIPVNIENDAYAAAIGEKYFGSGKRISNFIYLGIGTGLGGAIFIEDRLIRGNNGVSGLFGHIILIPNGRKCICGKNGCLECYVSGSAIEKRWVELNAYVERSKIKKNK